MAYAPEYGLLGPMTDYFGNAQVTSPNAQAAIQNFIATLPPIRGRWYFYDVKTGNDTSGDGSPLKPFAGIAAAYAACTTKTGDGICCFSYGSTAADTICYMDTPITWSKESITLVGVAAPTRLFKRTKLSTTDRTTGAIATISLAVNTIADSAGGFLVAGFKVGQYVRIASASDHTYDGSGGYITAVTATTMSVSATLGVKSAATLGNTTITSYMPFMIDFTGMDNRVYNMTIHNESTDALSIGGVIVNANRNYFENVHFAGHSSATPAADIGSFAVQVMASELTFKDCTFGNNSTLKAGNSAVLVITEVSGSVGTGQNIFENCSFLSYSTTVTNGIVRIDDAVALQGWTLFKNCSFVNWRSSKGTAMSYAFIFDATPNDWGVAILNCGLYGIAAWDNSSGAVYVVSPYIASGGGGLSSHT